MMGSRVLTGEMTGRQGRVSFLDGGGDVGAQMRAHDWDASPLGAPESWPQSLRSVVGLLLHSKFPMFVAWGSELGFLYNDPYARILGTKHPKALGRRFHDIWSEIWPDIAPLIDAAMAGQASYHENLPFTMNRHGHDEQTWFTFSYSPVRDESGRVAGMFCACTETTAQVLATRRRDALLKLVERLRDVDDTAHLSFAASEILGEALGVARVGYGTIDHDAGTIAVERNWFAPGFDNLPGVHRFADYGSYIADLRRGQAVANSNVELDPRTSANASAFRVLGIAAHLDIPVVEQARTVGLIFVHSSVPRVWTEEEISFVRDFAERTHAAIARRTAEQETRASEARYHTLFDKIDEGFCVIEFLDGPFGELSDYVHVEANPAYEANAGIPDIVGKRLREIVSGDEADAWAGIYRCVLVTGEPVRFERELVETGRHLELAAYRLEPESRRQVAVLFKDVTARRKAEEALRDSEARLRALNDTLEAQVATRSAERDRLWTLSQDMLAWASFDGKMSAVSPAWTQVLGWSETELLSRGYATFMHADDRLPTLEAITAMAQTREPARFENRIATRDGGWRHIEWTLVPEPDGVHFIAVGRDLSLTKAREAELERTQEALRQSQKMEAMGSLTGGVAHDFNNLLTPIVGTLDMLQRRGLGSEREQLLIAGAIQSADRAKTLVQRLLAFARRQPLQSTSVDLAPLVRGMADLVASTAGPQIKVVVDAPDGLPPAKADPNQLEMAILNLAVNARDAMPEGGSLRISVEAETVGRQHRTGLTPGRYLRLSVSDTGEGMDDETLKRAVEPFFSTKGIGKGTGLGLSMVHGLASQLGGALAIRSARKLGTNVELWLPQSTALPDATQPFSVAPSVARRTGTVLLVDDEDLVRLSTADMLIELGYSVVEASSAEEALKLVDRGLRPDLVVTDHLMPGISGTELARTLQSGRPGTKVLVVSGYAETEGIAPDLPRLTKPFRNADLAASLAMLSAGG